MLKTSLYDRHVELGAKMVDFAGFLMPIQYKNLKDEVIAVRNNVGVFDVSHMGEFFVEGDDTYRFLDILLPNDISGPELGKAIYSPLLNHDGHIIDDLIVYKLKANKALICVNASNIEKDFQWIHSQAQNFNVSITNKSDEYSLLAVQGPNAFKTLKATSVCHALEDIQYYSVQEFKNSKVIAARTGYTGEDGFEIFADHETIKKLFNELIEHDCPPCGLGARDVLRLEVCFPLYGNELNEELTPFECNLKWTVKLNKSVNFIGKDALLTKIPRYKLVKIILEKGIPRSHYPIYDAKDNLVGEITSGTMSVVLNQGIAFARVKVGEFPELFVGIRDKKYNATIVTKAFVTGGHK